MLAALADRWLIARHGRASLERLRQTGLLLAAGLIAGEALVGVLIAIPIVAAGDADVLSLPQRLQFGVWPGLLLIALLCFWVYRTATREARAVSAP